ncbi:MAG: hypothetical protein KGJ59_00165 [Bacteroidota bacterium]|nr:hypothetical protein [Bacteroidota bacterium]
MERFDFILSEQESISLQERNLNTGDIAVEICKIYFQHQYIGATFIENPEAGVDLEVIVPQRPNLQIEVKGTEERGLAPYQLGVSGNHSFQRLFNGLPLYRVSNVRQREITIWILTCPADFRMEPEPRWRIILNQN